MKIAYISVIRNDTDIILNNLIYYYNIGIRDFFIMLHMDTERKTTNMLQEFSLCYPTFNIRIFHNDINKHYHDKDLKVLTDAARSQGFQWMVGTDSDELLVLRKHKTIQEFISDNCISEIGIGPCAMIFRWANYRPYKSITNENAFVEFKHRKPYEKDHTKCIAWLTDAMHFQAGLHYVVGCNINIQIDSDVAFYAHFPDRSEEQYFEKIHIQYKNWMERYKSFPIQKELDADPNYPRKIWQTFIDNFKPSELIYDPIPEGLFVL